MTYKCVILPHTSTKIMLKVNVDYLINPKLLDHTINLGLIK